MQHPQAAWGHASGYTPDCRNRPRRAPAPPSLQAGIQVHRDALRHHEVVCQVYKCFILITTHDRWLLLLDQHAVDERIRVERLQRAVAAATLPSASAQAPTTAAATPVSASASLPSATTNEAIRRVAIKPMLLKRFTAEQLATLATPACRAFLARFCFDYQLLESHGALLLRSVPRIVDAVPDVNDFLPQLLRDFESMQQHQHGGGGGGGDEEDSDDGTVQGLFLPSALRETLNSRACRFAIMFHTELNRGRCKELLNELATTCAFPFQCAHGRPSCVPLCRLEDSGGVVVSERNRHHDDSVPLRFRSRLGKVHLRRFGEAMRQEQER